MQILLVDDDRFVLHALEHKIQWPALKVTRVFTAANMQQAKEIIQTEIIDLLISDIEMPQGSGLELLSWLRSEGSQLQTIFLTNYADFNYAQKAIELQSFEYYLKPIDYDKLSLIIKKALEKVHNQKNSLALGDSSKKQTLRTFFWERALSKPYLGKMDELRLMDDFKFLTFPAETQYALALITLFPYHLNWEPFKITTDSDLSRTLQASLETSQAHFSSLKKITAFRRNDHLDTFVLVIPRANTPIDSQRVLLDFLQKLKEELQQAVGWESLAITQTFFPFDMIEEATLELYRQADSFVPYRHFRPEQTIFSQKESTPTPIAMEFEKRLANHDGDACVAFIKETISAHELQHQVASDFLKALKLDLTQVLHSFLNKKEILAHQLLQNDDHHFLAERALNSVESFVEYFKYCIKTSLTFIDWSHSQKSVATIVKEYIDEHYALEINRSVIAEFVFLSPDHVARIFKKEMNISLGAYIIEQRLQAAQQLLTTTLLPINVIATQVGYDNYSYFTKLFKKHSHYTPQEFRQLFTP